jgi:glycosyltransferase involved in cell wall biosynthesis
VNRSVLIDGRLIGYRYGGIANYARQLAEHAPGLAQDLLVRLATKRPVKSLADRRVKVLTPPHHRLERYAFGLEVQARRPGLLHSVDYVQPVTRGIRSVVTVHDLAFMTRPELVTSHSYSYYSQISTTLPQADRVIAVSDWTRDQLVELLNVDPALVRVVPNGFDSRLYGPEGLNDVARLARLNPALGEIVTSERPIVLAVGTIEPRKRFDIPARVFDDRYQQLSHLVGSPPVLVIAGQAGWLSEEVVQGLRRLQQDGKAVWLRDIRDLELASLYRVATLLVMPSIDEGFGLPVLEAMASGTPALVANAGALPGLVHDCGFVEQSWEPAAWAEKIGRILADHETRNRRSVRGIERAATMTWAETARETVQVYREVLAE